jgi:hypothetical protein
MKIFFHAALGLAVSVVTSFSYAQSYNFDFVVPHCKMPAAKPMPKKYYELARRYKEFRWALTVKRTDFLAGGDGFERVHRSQMYETFVFDKFDLNNDGICDWFVTNLAPLSTGGDSLAINTIYLGQQNSWLRIGAKMPDSSPDTLGAGRSMDDWDNYSFSARTLIQVVDKSSKKSYFIGTFDSRSTGARDFSKGYTVYEWDNKKRNLTVLDKWEQGSAAEAAYAFFKANGDTPQSKMPKGIPEVSFSFGAEVEESEFIYYCRGREERWRQVPIAFEQECKKRKLGQFPPRTAPLK